MANVFHSLLTGGDLHEPKGVASADAGKVYIANGGGSGNWESIIRPSEASVRSYFRGDGLGGGAWVPDMNDISAAAKVLSNATAITPSGAGTFMLWTPAWTHIHAHNVGELTQGFKCLINGEYHILGVLTAMGQGTGANQYGFDWAVNGTPIGQPSKRTTSSTTDTGNIVVQGYLHQLEVNDEVQLMVTNFTDTDAVLITDFNVFMTKVGTHDHS